MSSPQRTWVTQSRVVTNLWLTLIVLLAAVLRFYALGTSSLWSDEGNTWALLGRSFAQIARDAAADIHPPGYYWLLKLWTALFGTTAVGMRSFSALAGVLLVYVIYRLGRLLWQTNPNELPLSALLAALLAAVNPFLIYYSQEARMYLLLTLAGAGLFWALLAWLRRERRWDWWLLGYLCWAVVGLWSHYTFPIILAAAGLGYLFIGWPKPGTLRATWWPFTLTNLLVILAYLPWLPTAVARLRHWPMSAASATPAEGVRLVLQTLLVGPLRELPQPFWPWLVGAALLPLAGLLLAWRRPAWRAIALWWLAPILLIFGAGLLTDAFLKFLLASLPAWALLTAATVDLLPRRTVGTLLIGSSALLLAWLVLPGYYRAPDARDNYQGVARYIAAVADPAHDLVLLDAPGQQEVWRYYDPGVLTLALPQQRPPDLFATQATLAAATQGRQTIYALFWATAEADPDQIVEGWLDRNAFQGIESWQGNLRFVTYSLPTDLHCTPQAATPHFGEQITLLAHCLSAGQPQIAAGEVLLVGLHWQTSAPIAQRYKVTLQLLDAANQVIAQRDSEPVGGSTPTDSWVAHMMIVDNHGLAIPVGTPPGSYQLILALYDPLSGTRLQVAGAEHFALGIVNVVRNNRPFPAAFVPVQHRVDRLLGAVRLVGYSAHRRGMAHAPQTPLSPGDPVEFTLIWQAPDPLPATWPPDLTFRLALGNEQVSLALAGSSYPTAQWQAGEIVRTKAELRYTGDDTQPTLTVGDDALVLARLPHTP